MNKFQDFGFPTLLNDALTNIGYSEPTPIQAKTIPPALLGKDILGSAQTGTGKTAAFMLPVIAQLLKDSEKTALILTPTRELAAQIMVFIQKLLGKRSFINTALLIGGEPMFPQLSLLRRNPRIFVGTPGRVNDHLSRGTLSLKKTGVFVLDEADRMLDMGFGVQIEAITEHLPAERQTLLFSATLPAAIIRLTQKYLNNPEHIHIDSAQLTPANIQQDTLNVTSENKFSELLKELDKRSGSVIIFVKTKHGTEKLARHLKDEGHSTDFLHGDLRQNRRTKVIKDFRENKSRIMIATDVAARGLDIPHIEHVINFDLPQCPEDYVHRIGRTARAGAKGFSLCLITPQDRRLWAAIQHMLDPKKNMRPASERSFGARHGGGRSSYFTGRERRDDNRGGFGSSPRYSKNNNRDGFGPSSRPSFERRDDNRSSFGSSNRPAFERRDNNRDDFGSSRRPSFEKRDDNRNNFGSSNRPTFERKDTNKSGFGSSSRSSSFERKDERGSSFDRENNRERKNNTGNRSGFSRDKK